MNFSAQLSPPELSRTTCHIGGTKLKGLLNVFPDFVEFCYSLCGKKLGSRNN